MRSNPPANTLIAVFVKRKHAIVKHWKHASQSNTLCEERIAVEAHPTGISRECLICQRVKEQLDAERMKVTV
jgi:hypothetical protein